jgi:molybdenum cofactor biosynthesis enzyme MoaA
MTMTTGYDFANILFAGPCNLRCPYCIGRQVEPGLNRNNLNEFPLRNLERFAALVEQHAIREITLTGTTTDPQLYRHEAHLLAWLRERLPEVRLSLHTNGQLALRKIDVVNRYERVTVSFPSFTRATYQKLTGSTRRPDLAEIMRQARVPVKVSAVLTADNVAEFDDFLARCHAIGVRRLVFRQLFGQTRQWSVFERLTQTGVYRQNPVYDYGGMEVTYWDFGRTESQSLNLFSNGVISPHYLLSRAAVGQ